MPHPFKKNPSRSLSWSVQPSNSMPTRPITLKLLVLVVSETTFLSPNYPGGGAACGHLAQPGSKHCKKSCVWLWHLLGLAICTCRKHTPQDKQAAPLAPSLSLPGVSDMTSFHHPLSYPPGLFHSYFGEGWGGRGGGGGGRRQKTRE